MIQLKDNSTSTVLDLAKEALDGFCDDLSTMFEVDIECSLKDSGTGAPKAIKKHFKKLGAVHTVKAEGSISGHFPLIFDQAGLFILAGVIVMLPEARIKEEAKRGSEKDAEAMSDAVGEVGNLLVGTWDRVFREELKGHKHFTKSNTYVGMLWDNAEEVIGIPEDQECDYAVYDLTVENYPSFACGVLLRVSDEVLPVAGVDSEPAAEVKTESAPETGEPEAEPESPAPQSEEPEPVEADEIIEEPLSEPAPSAEKDAVRDEDDGASPAPEPVSPVEAVVEEPVVDPGVPSPAPTMAIPIPLPSGGASAASLNLVAREILDPRVVWATAEDSVEQVLTLMQQHDVGYVLIGENNGLEGIVSKSNIMGALSPYLRPVFAKWRRPADDATLNIKVKWIMSRPVRTVAPNTTMAVMMEQMCQFGGRCLPVVDNSGKAIGLVTVFEILRVLNQSGGHAFVGRTPQAPCLMV